MKKKKVGIIASSVAAIAVCSSMVVGSTLALFTSEDKVNIAVTSGKVSLVAELGEFKTSSVKPDENGTVADENDMLYSYEELEDGNWANGGKVSKSGGLLTLSNITPGDKVEFEINLTDESTIAVQYNTSFKCAESSYELMKDVEITLDGVKVKGLAGYATAWKQLDVKTKTVPVCISFPITAGENSMAQENCEVSFAINAVQSNAAMPDHGVAEIIPGGNVKEVNSAAEIAALITSAEPAADLKKSGEPVELILTDDVDLSSVLLAKNDVTIYANGNTVTSTSKRGLRLGVCDITVEVNDADFIFDVNDSNIDNVRGIQFDGSANNVNLILNNCIINMTGATQKHDNYGINIRDGVGGSLTLNNCEITAYQAINVYSSNMDIVIENCKFTYVNNHNVKYSGGFITLFIGRGCHDINLTVKNSEFVNGETKEGLALPKMPICVNENYLSSEEEKYVHYTYGEDGDCNCIVTLENCTYDGEQYTEIEIEKKS